MDAEELLRRYLEQRREMGESELVLDTLTVDEVLRIVGAQGKRAPAPGASAPPGDWRRALLDADAGVAAPIARVPLADAAPRPSAARSAPLAPPALAPLAPLEPLARLSDLAPQGIVVGGGEAELFAGRSRAHHRSMTSPRWSAPARAARSTRPPRIRCRAREARTPSSCASVRRRAQRGRDRPPVRGSGGTTPDEDPRARSS